MVSAVGVWGGVEHKGRWQRESDLWEKRWVRSRSFTSLEVQIRDYGWSSRVAKPIKRRSLAGCDRERRPWADIGAPVRGGGSDFAAKLSAGIREWREANVTMKVAVASFYMTKPRP